MRFDDQVWDIAFQCPFTCVCMLLNIKGSVLRGNTSWEIVGDIWDSHSCDFHMFVDLYIPCGARTYEISNTC